MIRVTFAAEKVRIQQKVKESIARVARKAGNAFRMPRADVGVIFVRARKMRALNAKYRNVRTSTDVLSFALRDGERIPGTDGKNQPEHLGDIIINADHVQRISASAEEQGKRFVFLFVHGLLHLLQYDHSTVRQEKEMRGRERSLLGSETFYEDDHHEF